ncbi:actin-like ATPase domain-containing protein [Fomitiporia mediterranea MF3/22]|uniref:actin-like ATPase domain-containing protein n=1 Tax=Fomitiporia mediterranea (strain MF3/22) TaxID=694068 RepID=UPI0004409841|nr:actin-like ATPase domain-containing protein [Fomitiporia mediterranea MF3/22]EJD07271.1 actin-like ATPase domain-containing protein [Fomitiporia mediterranea MF3/22]
MSSSPLFLGLDLSTQQLKAIVISEKGHVVHETSVNFDRDLPQFGTKGGAIQGMEAGEVTSPVALWVAAMDLLLERMHDEHVEVGRIRGVSGAGQQHGSVYWSHDAAALLSALDAEKSLTEQLVPRAFSIEQSPIWQDSSTTKECRELEEAVGGKQALADLSGSRAYERFTGTQIMKIRKRKPDAYVATSRISLVSSFIPSLFLGEFAPIDAADASGMNLMNVFTHKWDDRLLEICGGPELRAKLGPEPVNGGSFVGRVSPYWVKRWGFSPDCQIAPFTGDNPATVASFSESGDAILSLGTSTTFLLDIPPSKLAPARFTTSHLLAHPADEDRSIAMLCYKNGGLAREQVRDTHADGSWEKFNSAVETTPPGNNGHAGLYFPLVEIIPDCVHGNFYFKDTQPVQSIPEVAHPRAIIESQFLSVKSRVEAVLPPDAPHLRRLILTGGSSANPTIRQLAADIFGLPAYVSGTKEAAGHGGAVLALYAWVRTRNGGQGSFDDLKGHIADNMRLVATPNPEITKLYEGLVGPYRSCEDQVVKTCAERRRF